MPTYPTPMQSPEVLRAHLRDNPTDLNAWLQLSRLVDGPAQASCLLQAAALLQHVGVSDTSRPAVVPSPVPGGQTPRRLGEVLIARGVLSAEALDAALQEQHRRRNAGDLVPLGEILMQHKLVTARVLAQALVALHQQRTRLFLLGEYLLDAGLLSADDLVDALEQQIEAAQRGRYIRLGEILIGRGIITQDVLDQFLAQQQAQRTQHESRG